MKILLLGSGGREHAFAWKLAASDLVEQLFISPGNPGTALCGINVPINPLNFQDVYNFAVENNVDLIIPGNEDPLVEGISDFIFAENNQNNTTIKVAGPSRFAAQLEGSKDFSKSFMQRHGIPTADSVTITEENLYEGFEFLHSQRPPFVLKADGLAAGKGVIITEDLQEARKTLEEMIVGQKFGKASQKVVIEQFLSGIEISVFAVSDGKSWKTLASAKDYKRIGEGDTGPNTGGMGAISPVPFADSAFMQKVEDTITSPTFSGLIAEGYPFVGFLFMGLMNCNGTPYVIEYNVRMGDPETESIFPRLKTDLAQICLAMAEGTLTDVEISMDNRFSATVFLTSAGYPASADKGKTITLPNLETDTMLFHAGTGMQDDKLQTAGGRVLAANGLGTTLNEAMEKAMKLAGNVQFEGKYFRRDIGRDLINATKR